MLLALTQQWLVVSDLHVEPFDRSPQPSAYGSDTNWALFDSTVAQMRRAEPNPAVVVIAGDFLAHHFAAKVRASKKRQSTLAVAEATMARIERSFARAFPKAQFVIALGNNDDPCGDYSTAPNSPYLKSVAKMWAPLVDRRGAAPDFVRDFSHSGYYTAKVPLLNARIVVLDSVFWSFVYRSCGAGGGNAPAEQLAAFNSTLSRPGAQPSVVLMHIPPGVDASSTLLTHRFLVVPFLQGGQQGRFESIVARHSSSIPFIVAGHLHQNDFRVIEGVPMLIAPSVSPVYNNNPSFLRLQVGSGGVLQDYQLFAYAIDEDAWAGIFDFDRAYGVNGFTAGDLRIAHERIAKDPAVREKWAASADAGSRSTRIDRGNWRAYWCAQTFAGSQYVACAGDRRRVAAVPIAAAIAGLLLLAGLAAIVLRLASQRQRS